MILQSLVKLYDDLARAGEISRPGWGKSKVGFALCIDGDGDIRQIVPTLTEANKNGKTVTVNQTMELPAAVSRSSGVFPNFLFDNSGYVLGMDNKGKPQRSLECFEACKEHHKRLLADVDCEAAKGILNYFEKWTPETLAANEIVAEYKEELIKGSNIVFRVNGVYAHEVKDIADAWQKFYDKAEGDVATCLLTGEADVIERVHPLIKGVDGAQTSGAAVVSFNADAFCSYNRSQGYNAPIGKKAAFAYTTALNYLLSERQSVQHIGDTSIVCWTDGAHKPSRDFALDALFGVKADSAMDEDTLHALVKKLANGIPCPEMDLDPSKEFYILGIAPNASRLSVRFFLRTSFGTLMKNINDHHERCEIVGSRYKLFPLWALLRETVNLNSTDKSPSPAMAGAVTRAVFSGSAYPASLLEATMLRIRAQRDLTAGQAAIIKAYYLKNTDKHCPKEVLTVSLNENSTNIPYTLGRLFAVYENVQENANPGINATIKDKYFNSAASTPAHIFPILDNLSQKHLRKLEPGKRIYFEKQIGELKNVMGETNPMRLSLPEQGSFYLGYYHQKEKRFEKKENN
ncbi:MAG: type I-C CRISPR-associated protein Cas8c/Csd1 [Eubacteriales bacterium]